MNKKYKRYVHKRIQILKKLLLGIAKDQTIKPEEWCKMFTTIHTVARVYVHNKETPTISITAQLSVIHNELKDKYYLLDHNYHLLKQQLRITQESLRHEKNRSDIFYARYWEIKLKLISDDNTLKKMEMPAEHRQE